MTVRFESEKNVKQNREKLDKILEDKSPALMLGGIMGTDMRIAKAAYEGGCRIFEPNHPAMALQMGLHGVTNMNDAEQIRHKVPFERMLTPVQGLNDTLDDDIFITVGARGTFTEIMPVEFTQEDAYRIAAAGGHSLHTHKSHMDDVARITEIAHNAGLLSEAYITDGDHLGLGVSAPTEEDLIQTIKDFEKAGVDMIGLVTGKTYQGQSATGFSEEFLRRCEVFLRETNVVTLLEGGITKDNIGAVKDLGFDILVISTAVDDYIEESTVEIVSELNE